MFENIYNLVRTEYKKFGKNAAVRILLGSFLVLAPFIILVGKRLFKYAPPPFPSPLSLFEFPMIWDYQAYINHHLIYILLGYFVIYTVCSEISNKTMRQNIITGYTKKEYFMAKLYSYIVLSLIASLLFFVSCLVLGLAHTEGVSLSLVMDNRWLPVRYFLCCMGFMTFAMFVALWVRRSGIAMFLYFSFIVGIEQMLRGVFIYVTKSPEGSRWFPLNVYEDLLPNPMYRLDKFFKMFDRDVELVLPQEYATVLAVVYIFIFTWLAWWIFSRRDV